jgi:hypothetical protein
MFSLNPGDTVYLLKKPYPFRRDGERRQMSSPDAETMVLNDKAERAVIPQYEVAQKRYRQEWSGNGV